MTLHQHSYTSWIPIVIKVNFHAAHNYLIQDEDSRIFLLSMFSITALPFLCEVSYNYFSSDMKA